MLKFCSQPWDTINIYNNGDVSACLCQNWNFRDIIGNIHQNSLADIMQSPGVLEFKESIISQKFNHCNFGTCGKVWNMDQVDNLDNLDYLPKLPTTIMLAIDNNCNLRCASCRTGNIYTTEVDQNVYRVLKNLEENYKDFDLPVKIFCDGSGDIFASAAYQKWFKEGNIPKCFNFTLTTNGNLIIKNLDLLDRLSANCNLEVVISLDAATSETYKQIRGGNFEIVLEGIQQLANRRIRTLTQYVVQAGNYQEILDYVELCKGLAVRFIGLQKITRWPHMNDTWWIKNNLDDNPNVDYNFLKQALDKINSDALCVLCGGLQRLRTGRQPTSTAN